MVVLHQPSGRAAENARPGRGAARAALAILCFYLLCGVGVAAHGECEADQAAAAAPLYLSLEAAQRRALADNPTLQAVEARVRQAAERVKQARAAFLPTLDLEWSAAHTQLPDRSVREARQGVQAQLLSNLSRFSGMPPVSPLDTASSLATAAAQAAHAYDAIPESMDNYSVRMVLGYPLFTGFARKHAHAMARFGAAESAAAANEARRLMLEAVAQAYHGAQLARARTHIAEADKAFNLRLLDEARARERVGAAALSEVLNFEVRVRASEAQHIAATEDLQLAFIALAALMGDHAVDLSVDTAFEDIECEAEETATLPDYEELYARARALRPDLEASRLAAARATTNVGLQRAPFYPTVAAFVSKDASRTDSGSFEGQDFATTVGVTLSYNLFAGGRHRAALAEARQTRKEAEHQQHAAEIAAAEELRAALARLTAARRQLTLQRENADYVEQHRDMVEKEFQAGQTSLALLNQAQRDLVEARATLALAQVSTRAARHALRTATGETLTDIQGE